MDSKDAEDALAMIRNVVNKVHDTSILQNWGGVMIILAVLDLIVFCTTQVMLIKGVHSAMPYFMIWGIYILLALIVNLKVRNRMGGTSTYVERHIWGNGLTFYMSSLAIVVLDFKFLEPAKAALVLPAHMAVIGAVSFAFIALLDARFFIQTAAFLVLAFVLGWWPEYGFAVLGAAWFVGLLIPGIRVQAERKKLIASGQYTDQL